MNKTTQIIISIVILIAIILLVVFSRGATTDTSTIRVGIIAPLTGTGA
jgi:hypothetical protein